MPGPLALAACLLLAAGAAVTAPAGDLLPVPAGEFWMGCNPEVDKQCQADENPGRKVWLRAFRIDRNEVTTGQFRACVAAGACSAEGITVQRMSGQPFTTHDWACNWGQPRREEHPINCVSWEQARAYCAWAGKRLPTEAEWEKAARGSADRRRFPWGDQGLESSVRRANVVDQWALDKFSRDFAKEEKYSDGYEGTSPVGAFPEGRSPYGALDMAGNVCEWVADRYAADAHATGPNEDPKGAKDGDKRVFKGGSFGRSSPESRISRRDGFDPTDQYAGLGFRCAVDAK
ncbi:MAG TPA: SUMF1/EgtB/PvdO family nonheme iron enzyme [Myxococcota bacterium]|nr:SUMF1/EgtB/PvdO family nonheme iron enzyme [Myxococcota bacterium]HRY96301.1 SUMF1/EgtB/PvdO family nonheme iron enzyme [Myxococcota bacterium]HSA23133.1 SUMF1/EgtB/PvdO family nonheme iron enzyme [Myxococcota bacterium]